MKMTTGGARNTYTKPSGYIGIANLSEQVHRKIAKRGFQFTLMLVGETGLGKTTLINNLFHTNIQSQRHLVITHQENLNQSTHVEPTTIDIEECGVKVRLTIVNTFGYGDSINCTDNYTSIVDYINKQFECYFNGENGLNRRNLFDNRVHCLFYFISSFTRGLKPLDIKCMKALHHKVNIVPIIAKADSLTTDELIQMKQDIIEQLHHHQIDIYQIPDCDSDEDEELKLKNLQIKQSLPFAIISSQQTCEVKGKTIHARSYPWGLVDIEDSRYCDLLKLRTMIITHMQDFQQLTHDVHYENYRTEKIHIEYKKQLLQDKDEEPFRKMRIHLNNR